MKPGLRADAAGIGDGRARWRTVTHRTLLLLLFLTLELLPVPGFAVTNPLLDGFGSPGSGGVEIAGTGIRAVAVQPWDAKIVIGGEFTITSGMVTWQNLARIKHDGTLDTSFLPPALNGPVSALALQPDGRIVR